MSLIIDTVYNDVLESPGSLCVHTILLRSQRLHALGAPLLQLARPWVAAKGDGGVHVGQRLARHSRQPQQGRRPVRQRQGVQLLIVKRILMKEDSRNPSVSVRKQDFPKGSS